MQPMISIQVCLYPLRQKNDSYIVRIAQRLADIIILCHGGPIAEPEDAKYVLSKVKGLHGFFGASSVERLPVEKAITETTKAFKTIET